jgi:hypothetical protein
MVVFIRGSHLVGRWMIFCPNTEQLDRRHWRSRSACGGRHVTLSGPASAGIQPRARRLVRREETAAERLERFRKVQLARGLLTGLNGYYRREKTGYEALPQAGSFSIEKPWAAAPSRPLRNAATQGDVLSARLWKPRRAQVTQVSADHLRVPTTYLQ